MGPQTSFSGGPENKEGLLLCQLALLSKEWVVGEGPLDRLHRWYRPGKFHMIKIMFLGKVEIAVRSGIKLRFGIMCFSL